MRRGIRVATLVLGGLPASDEVQLAQELLGAGAGLGTAAILDGDLTTGAVIGAAGNMFYGHAWKGRC